MVLFCDANVDVGMDRLVIVVLPVGAAVEMVDAMALVSVANEVCGATATGDEVRKLEGDHSEPAGTSGRVVAGSLKDQPGDGASRVVAGSLKDQPGVGASKLVSKAGGMRGIGVAPTVVSVRD